MRSAEMYWIEQTGEAYTSRNYGLAEFRYER